MGSSLLSDLTVSVDFYDIKIKDAIGIVPGNAVVRACFNTGGENPTYSNDNFYCSLIKRGFISLQQVQTPTLNLARIHTSGIDTQVDWRVGSEEHTSELQSLMRISYAVFCLKKKKKK